MHFSLELPDQSLWGDFPLSEATEPLINTVIHLSASSAATSIAIRDSRGGEGVCLEFTGITAGRIPEAPYGAVSVTHPYHPHPHPHPHPP